MLCIHPEVSELILKELHEGFVGATWEVDLCPIEPSHRAIGGQTCRRKPKNM